MGKVFVNALIQGKTFPALKHAAGNFTWDSNKKTVTTPKYAEREQQQVLDDAACYKDEYGTHMSTNGPKKKKEYASPEMMYDIHGEHCIKTIHEHTGKGYAGTPGASNIYLKREKV